MPVLASAAGLAAVGPGKAAARAARAAERTLAPLLPLAGDAGAAAGAQPRLEPAAGAQGEGGEAEGEEEEEEEGEEEEELRQLARLRGFYRTRHPAVAEDATRKRLALRQAAAVVRGRAAVGNRVGPALRVQLQA